MTYRMTVVLEYEKVEDAPRIGVDTTDFGPAKVAALQFSDALKELEALEEKLVLRELGNKDRCPTCGVHL